MLTWKWKKKNFINFLIHFADNGFYVIFVFVSQVSVRLQNRKLLFFFSRIQATRVMCARVDVIAMVAALKRNNTSIHLPVAHINTVFVFITSLAQDSCEWQRAKREKERSMRIGNRLFCLCIDISRESTSKNRWNKNVLCFISDFMKVGRHFIDVVSAVVGVGGCPTLYSPYYYCSALPFRRRMRVCVTMYCILLLYQNMSMYVSRRLNERTSKKDS